MQRSEPRAPEPEPTRVPTGFATTGSQPHTQSFEEIYGVPENFLEIEVRTSAKEEQRAVNVRKNENEC